MPHRIGFLYDKMISEENCILAERTLGKNKPDNAMAQHIARHAERYGKELSVSLINGTFTFHPNREKTIMDSYKGKQRHLKIPCLEDQAAQIAWLNIAAPHLLKRNYYYNCGSVPGAGQSRSVNGLKKWLKDPKMKYADSSDIRKFYDTCPHWAVMKGLRRIFKDEKFLAFAERDLANMSDTGVGIAIGHPTSHWYANVALSEIDHEQQRRFPDVRMTRYADNVALVSRNKRHLKWAAQFVSASVKELGMAIKNDWQLFPIKARGLQFLSYRFYNGFTILAKKLMFRIARKMKRGAKRLTVHMAEGIMSYFGIMKHCNSYNFKQERVFPFINKNKCRRIISNASKNTVCTAPG